MKTHFKFLLLYVFVVSYLGSNAQVGSILAPTHVTYGFGSAWQPKYASGFGFTSQTHISFFDFLKDREKTGFRIRDVWGGYFSLGALTHPDIPTISTGSVTVKGPIWYDTGFDLGLQTLYGFNKDIWLSLKGQMGFSFNNAAYFEHPFPTSYDSRILTGGLQIHAVGFEFGKGWAGNKQGSNFLTLAASYELKEKPGKSTMIGIRYSQHDFHEASSVSFGHIQKNYFFSVFYAFCI